MGPVPGSFRFAIDPELLNHQIVAEAGGAPNRGGWRGSAGPARRARIGGGAVPEPPASDSDG